MAAVRVWLWRATIAVGLVLLATGVWLAFFYRPTHPGTGMERLRAVHRGAALPFPLLGLALGSLTALHRERVWPAVVGVVLLALGLALSFTGFLLPWDQLALYAVTVGTNMRGLVTAAFSDDVKFVLIGGSEISQATLRMWFILHAALLPVAVVVCLALLRQWGRRGSNPRATH